MPEKQPDEEDPNTLFVDWNEDELVLGARRSEWCMDCLVTHDVFNIYGVEAHNLMDAILVGEYWDCDEDEDLWEDNDE